MSTNPQLTVRTLGGLQFSFNGVEEPALRDQRKRAAFLIYLAVSRSVSVDELARTIWRDSRDPRHALHTTAHRLRNSYGAVFEIEHGMVKAGDNLKCDLADWNDRDEGRAPADLLALYGGRFLKDWSADRVSQPFGTWADGIDGRLAVEVRTTRARHCRALLERDHTEDCVTFGRAWVSDEPGEDEAHYWLIRSLEASGDLEGARIALGHFQTDLLRDGQELPSRFEDLVRWSRADGSKVDADSTAGGRPAVVHHGASQHPRSRRFFAKGIAAAAGLGLVGLFAWTELGDRTAPAVGIEQFGLNRIAVLEFEDLSDDQSLADLARGLQRSLIHQLATVSEIHVVSPAGVRDIDPATAEVARVGRELGVGNLVTGQVQASDGHVRVFVQLVDPGDGEFVRTQQIDVPASDLFGLQDEITQFATRFLRERLGDEIRVREYQMGTRNSDAWVLVQQAYEIGEPYWEVHGMSPDHSDPATAIRLDRAADLAEQAMALDPTWAEARYVRAMVENAKWLLSGRLSEGREVVMSLALAVLELDQEHFRTHALIGALVLDRATRAERPSELRDSLFTAAEESLRRAVEGQPNLAIAWGGLADVAKFQGRGAEALAYAIRAVEEDPFLSSAPTIYRRIGLNALENEDFEMSAEWLLRGRRLYPEEPRFLEALLTLEHFSGYLNLSPDSIRALLDEANRLDPPTTEGKEFELLYFYRRIAAAGALARAGEQDTARAMLARVHAEVAGREVWYPEVVGSEIPVYLTLGDTATAVAKAAEWLTIGDFGVEILRSHFALRAVVPLLPDSVLEVP